MGEIVQANTALLQQLARGFPRQILEAWDTWIKKIRHSTDGTLPSRGLTYPTWGKENHLQNAIFGGYVSSLEGIFPICSMYGNIYLNLA